MVVVERRMCDIPWDQRMEMKILTGLLGWWPEWKGETGIWVVLLLLF